MKQQIIIAPNGSITSLEQKRGRGLDIRKLGGQADIVRTSVIEFVPDIQRNVVILLNVTLLMERHTQLLRPFLINSRDTGKVGLLATDTLAALADMSGIRPCAPVPETLTGTPYPMLYKGAVVFDDYEDAVTFEVELVQCLRKKFGPDIV